MEDKKKRFVIPEAEIIDFSAEDIITTSMTAGADPFNFFENGGDDGEDCE